MSLTRSLKIFKTIINLIIRIVIVFSFYNTNKTNNLFDHIASCMRNTSPGFFSFLSFLYVLPANAIYPAVS